MAKAPVPIEHAIQLMLLEYLRYQRDYVWPNNSGALRNRRGIPVRFGKW
jgi:hypothetical protein